MPRRGLLDVRRFVVPADVLATTLASLSSAGRKGFEAFVVWGGIREDGGKAFRFQTVLMPRQESYRTDHGLLVHIEEDAIDETNRSLNERGMILGGQAHSHPTGAYHSDTDDTLPLVTLLGGISVVVPDFALGQTDPGSLAWFRLMGYGRWLPIDDDVVITVEG